MPDLAPARVRAEQHGDYWYWTATCRLCGDSCSFAGEDSRQDWMDALAWCYGHEAVWHPRAEWEIRNATYWWRDVFGGRLRGTVADE